MAKWRSLGHRMLYCDRSLQKIWFNCSDLASFHCTCGGGLFLGGGWLKRDTTMIRHCSSSSAPPVSPPPTFLSSSPLLMVPPGVVVVDDYKTSVKQSNQDDYFHFLSLSAESQSRQFRARKFLSIPWQRDLLTPNDAPCVGSSHGWLAFNHPLNCYPYLYNPLIVSPDFPYIPLPSIETLPSVHALRQLKPDLLSPFPSLITHFSISLQKKITFMEETYQRTVSPQDICSSYIRKLVMSSAPSLPSYSSSSSSTIGNDCTIMAIHSGSEEIAFCKPGDDRWTDLEDSLQYYSDLIYFSKDQQFYALLPNYSIQAWDLSNPSCPKNQVFACPQICPGNFEEHIGDSYNSYKSNYIVESSGDLLLISRFIALSVAHYGIVHPRRLEVTVNSAFIHDDEAYWTLGFDVHKFDFDHNKWELVESLGDQAVFVGSNHSFSLSTCDYPELMENSIYFTDDNFMEFNKTYHGHDNGIFCLGDYSIKPCYPSRLKIIDPRPVWVAPNTM